MFLPRQRCSRPLEATRRLGRTVRAKLLYPIFDDGPGSSDLTLSRAQHQSKSWMSPAPLPRRLSSMAAFNCESARLRASLRLDRAT